MLLFGIVSCVQRLQLLPQPIHPPKKSFSSSFGCVFLHPVSNFGASESRARTRACFVCVCVSVLCYIKSRCLNTTSFGKSIQGGGEEKEEVVKTNKVRNGGEERSSKTNFIAPPPLSPNQQGTLNKFQPSSEKSARQLFATKFNAKFCR